VLSVDRFVQQVRQKQLPCDIPRLFSCEFFFVNIKSFEADDLEVLFHHISIDEKDFLSIGAVKLN